MGRGRNLLHVTRTGFVQSKLAPPFCAAKAGSRKPITKAKESKESWSFKQQRRAVKTSSSVGRLALL